MNAPAAGTIITRELQGEPNSPRQFMVRHGTDDTQIIDEHFQGRGYSRGFVPQQSDWVLDVGAHIGAFSLRCAGRCRGVTAYEPDPSNYAVLMANVALNRVSRSVECREAAIVGNRDEQRELYVSTKARREGAERRGSASSMFVSRGRTSVPVRCENINDVMRGVRPTVLKLDCEGAEYEILMAADRLQDLRVLLVEFHVAMLYDRNLEKYAEVLARLRTKFPHVNGHSPDHLTKAWTRDIVAWR